MDSAGGLGGERNAEHGGRCFLVRDGDGGGALQLKDPYSPGLSTSNFAPAQGLYRHGSLQ